jgi:hypothetical protein
MARVTNRNGPIHEVPRSVISYTPKNAASCPDGIICENSDRESACDPPSTTASTAPIIHA